MTSQKFFKTVVAAGLVAGMAGMLASAPVQAKPGVKLGSLKCSISGGTGRILTSTKSLKCTLYKLNGKRERYRGVIRRYGVDIGVTGKAKMVWLVFAPASVTRNALRGSYVGAAADASVIIGGGAKVLIGGFDRSIMLQPVSLQVQTGVNVAAGVTTLELH